MGARRPHRNLMAVALALAVSPMVVATHARADSGPTSGQMSVSTGRTIGVGEKLLAGGVGWPGIWAEALFAPSSRFNLGPRLDVLYGSAWLGLGTGVGGEVSLPMRIHVLGEGHVDLAIAVRPFVTVGEGANVGERGVYTDSLGWSAGTDAGMRLGWQVTDAVTLGFGAGGSFGYLGVPDDAQGTHPVGSLFGELAIEGLLRPDTLLFAELAAGGGFATARLFGGHGVLRVSLGIAFLL